MAGKNDYLDSLSTYEYIGKARDVQIQPGADNDDYPFFQPPYARVDHLPTLNMMIPAQTNYSWVAANFIAGNRANEAQYDPALGNFNTDSTARDPGFPLWDRRPHVSPLSNWGNRFSLPRGGRS
jgi:hypothetical protein